jgi:tetratricopeptide (TPR) repeat protein
MTAAMNAAPDSSEDPLVLLVEQAQAAAQHGDLATAIRAQEEAVALLYQAGQEEQETLITLSVFLFNLAEYYGQAERYADAVKALEEVVKLDEATDNPDLEVDRRTLQSARKIAALSPTERQRLKTRASSERQSEPENEFEASLQAQLAMLPPAQRAEAEAALRQVIQEFQSLPPEEQAAKLATQQLRSQTEDAAAKMRDAALAYACGEAPDLAVLDYIRALMEQIFAHESPGSTWYEVGQLCAALMAAIQNQPIPPVPPVYAAHLSAVLSALKEKK